MKKIEFSNFRRFNNLGPLHFGKVTLLSGGNNSGKSTIVKAAMLAISYLKTKDTNQGSALSAIFDNASKKFFFDLDNVHISSFKRALNNNCDVKSDLIEFGIELGDFDFHIKVKSSEYDSNTYGLVSYLNVYDSEKRIDYTFDFDNATMTISFSKEEYEAELENKTSIETDIENIQYDIKQTKDLEVISSLNMKLAELEKKLEIISNSILTEEPTFSFHYVKFIDYIGIYSIASHIHSFIGIAGVKSDNKKEEKSQKKGKEFIRSKEGDIVNSINRLTNELNYTEIEFIGAHAASQEAVLSIKDDTYPARTIHEFCKSGIGRRMEESTIVIGHRQELPKAEKFIIDSMKALGIGSKAKIYVHNNEAYEFYIEDENGKSMPLADKGMGSIQLMILILRLATLISQYKYAKIKPLILIEEPEQNLHPKTQSLLADFFFNIAKDFGFQILVETHSEYMVRKMQVLYAKAIKKENISEEEMNDTIKVYFFPDSNEPYSMTFRKNGRFENDFGTGFLDEAGKWNRELNVIEYS